MTLTKEDFAHVREDDWLHVEFENGDQVSGVASLGEMFIWIRPLGSPGALAMADETRGPVKIIAHRPTKRTPKVGDVIKRDDWERYDWPEGMTRFSSAGTTLASIYSVDGWAPRYVTSGTDVVGGWPVTVMQIPTPAGDPAPRVLTTVEEVDALPVGSIILDADDDTAKREQPAANGGVWITTGDSTAYASRHLPLPVTVLREGEATS